MSKTERKFIVVDEKRRPMSFQHEQFCYVSTRGRSRFFLKMYTETEANELIKKTIEFRDKHNFPIGEYNLMPLK